ncbi:hypothetical protein RchiOBHm_Chr4g0392471 [Rosa chinensis]|uniref:Uncharacterized protein n=1 Tax=Rosa chinensis TaxID=74649 RepID=A0A2P6QQR9_ROSCH|nr:hypothetical protein RchiOBHm_Chr4g0392471 [Rosa chinensis]
MLMSLAQSLQVSKWVYSKGVVQHLYFGRNPPMFTEMRLLRQSTGDDHLGCSLGIGKDSFALCFRFSYGFVVGDERREKQLLPCKSEGSGCDRKG